MIEVPSAALITDLLAKECDFLSIGTNDLVQYSLAVDRGNHALSGLYTPAHPGVIRLIKMVVNEADHYGTPLEFVVKLLRIQGMCHCCSVWDTRAFCGITQYSSIKHVIRNTSIVAATRLAEQALALSCPSEIQELISREYSLNVPEDCFTIA